MNVWREMSWRDRLIALGVLVGIGAGLAAYVENLLWLFDQRAAVPFILGLLGVFLPPLGAAHGIYLWFI